MARPPVYQDPDTLHVTLEKRIKRMGAWIAFRRNVSVSQLVARLFLREFAELSDAERDAGERIIGADEFPEGNQLSSDPASAPDALPSRREGRPPVALLLLVSLCA